MLRALLTLCTLLVQAPAQACDTALLLTMDVSNSVDAGEYRLQTDGLADALADPEIVETMVRGEVALAVVQWSGVDRQEVTIPWTRMRTALDVAAFAQRTRLMVRAFILSDTAPAEAMTFALDQFGPVADCARKVIDVSGDGTPNAGSEIGPVRRRAERMGVTINGIAIESMGITITNFYRRAVITRDGFVLTARGHRDYPRAIRLKILREITTVIGALPEHQTDNLPEYLPVLPPSSPPVTGQTTGSRTDPEAGRAKIPQGALSFRAKWNMLIPKAEG